MRLFVAIELDDRTASAVAATAACLRLFGRGSFCPEGSYHMTLAFIGESDRASDIMTAMDAVDSPCFELSLGDIGRFGTTYYVAVEGGPALRTMQKELCDRLRDSGFEIDGKPFTPHITLARRFEKQSEPVVFVPERRFSVRGISLMATVGAGVYKRLYYKGFVG